MMQLASTVQGNSWKKYIVAQSTYISDIDYLLLIEYSAYHEYRSLIAIEMKTPLFCSTQETNIRLAFPSFSI